MTREPIDPRIHWEGVYASKSDAETSWFQEEPEPSLSLVRSCVTPRGRVIDVGGGASLLGARLAALEHDVAVLDVSSAAIERAKARAGHAAGRIRWLVGDLTALSPRDLGADATPFDCWHDRAVFHFLIDPRDRAAYASLAAQSVREGGHLVIATFAPSGPEKCSGLPVVRHDAPALAAAFAPAFELVRSIDHAHPTPWGTHQSFTFALLRRRRSR